MHGGLRHRQEPLFWSPRASSEIWKEVFCLTAIAFWILIQWLGDTQVYAQQELYNQVPVEKSEVDSECPSNWATWKNPWQPGLGVAFLK